MIHLSKGIVACSLMANGSKKMVVNVDQGLVDVAFAMTPKYHRLQRQKYPPHISVVRNEWFESPLWGKHEGEVVEFTYDPCTRNDETYHWLRVWCDRLGEIRQELGLSPSRDLTRPPDGEDCFHITIGNTKNGA